MQIKNGKECTGCGACACACPQKCIEMKKNEEGFLYPVIDNTSCTECGVCRQKCPQEKNADDMMAPQKIYAASAKDKDVLKGCTSGGIVPTAAKAVLRQKGAVFGVEMGRDFRARVICVENEKDLTRIRKSKYVQAATGIAYREAAYLLKTGRKVLYTGTPCQIAGLRRFLGKEYENLYTIDLVCHGVPSPEMFVSHVRYMEKKHGQRILRWNFRDKRAGGWSICDLIEFEHKERRQRELLDPYTWAFLKGLTLRESCYECQYAQRKRFGDITCGDYWGIEKAHPGFPDEQGASMLMINTPKGEELFSMFREDIWIEESCFENAAKYNRTLIHPTLRPAARGVIYKKWAQMPADGFEKKVLRPDTDLAETARQYAPQWAKNLVRKIKRGMRKRKDPTGGQT